MRTHTWLAPALAAAVVLGTFAFESTAPGLARDASLDDAPSAPLGLAWDAADARVSDPASLFPGAQRSLYEASVAIDPTNPMNVLAFAIDLTTQNVDAGSYSTNRQYRSQDGGLTWTDLGPIRYRDGDAYWDGGDPVVLFTPEGVAYFASLSGAPDGSEEGIYVHRSDDGGASWHFPVRAVAGGPDPRTGLCAGTDKEWLSHDDATGTLYLAYSLFEFDCEAPPVVGDPSGGILRMKGMSLRLTKSVDGGATWAAPKVVQQGYRIGGMPRTAPEGTLYMTFFGNALTSTTGCPSLLGVIGTAVFHEPGLFDAIYVGVSTDGGDTWRVHQESKCTHDFAETTKPGRFVGGNFMPSLSVDPATGAAHVVYPHFVVAQNRYTVMHIASTDGGATWSAPRDVTPRADEDARMPTLVADGAALRLVYLISRDADNTGDVAYAESTDGGATWTERALLTTEPWQLADDPDLGDYLGLDARAGRLAVVWTDARNGVVTEIWSRGADLP